MIFGMTQERDVTMKKEEIQPFDWQRILFGQMPAEFIIEVLFRTVVIYLILLVVLRLLGKRTDGQLTIMEFGVMVTFGAIVAVPMQMAERGILLGVVALLCILAFERGLNWLAVKNNKVEETVQGKLSILVKDGVLQLNEMHRVGMSKQNLFASLRTKEIFNLGKVKRVYFEACGIINIYKDEGGRPGLAILPANEIEFMERTLDMEDSKVACANCGYVVDASAHISDCDNCHENNWMKAVC
jgi:uncharacterized membrane protein YcaP (DUF421 family)